MQIFNHPAMKKRRRQLRRDQTRAEQCLWQGLRGHRLGGYKFYRQYSVDRYVLDFYNPDCHLAVELDGGYHLRPDVAAYDARRTEYLNSVGIVVIRFQNHEVFDDMQGVLERIAAVLEGRRPRK